QQVGRVARDATPGAVHLGPGRLPGPARHPSSAGRPGLGAGSPPGMTAPGGGPVTRHRTTVSHAPAGPGAGPRAVPRPVGPAVRGPRRAVRPTRARRPDARRPTDPRHRPGPARSVR